MARAHPARSPSVSPDHKLRAGIAYYIAQWNIFQKLAGIVKKKERSER
jgi:hypothetical protein